MGDINIILIATSIGLLTGGFIGYFILKKAFKKDESKANDKANLIIKEANINAENIKKDKILEAKEKFLQLKTEFEEEANKKKNLIISNESKLRQREQNISKQIEQLQRKEAEYDSMKENLAAQMEIVKKRKAELDKVRQEQVSALEKIANLSREEALEKMMVTLQDEAQTKASSNIKDILEEAKLTANKEAKNIIIKTLQRTATEHTIENCVSVFNIEIFVL